MARTGMTNFPLFFFPLFLLFFSSQPRLHWSNSPFCVWATHRGAFKSLRFLFSPFPSSVFPLSICRKEKGFAESWNTTINEWRRRAFPSPSFPPPSFLGFFAKDGLTAVIKGAFRLSESTNFPLFCPAWRLYFLSHVKICRLKSYPPSSPSFSFFSPFLSFLQQPTGSTRIFMAFPMVPN